MKLTKEWESRVRSGYNPRKKSSISYHTIYKRHNIVNWKLAGYVEDMGPDVNALLVGTGRQTMKTYPTEHIELSNLLSEKDYRMTILDSDARALHDAVKIDGAVDEITMEWVEPPLSFHRKKKNYEVSFVLGDIVTFDLSPYGPFDIVQCLNVLRHVGPEYDAKAANEAATLGILNMSRNMKKGGIMVIDDIRYNLPNLSHYRRKPGKRLLKELGLEEAEEPIKSPEKSFYLFYRKI